MKNAKESGIKNCVVIVIWYPEGVFSFLYSLQSFLWREPEIMGTTAKIINLRKRKMSTDLITCHVCNVTNDEMTLFLNVYKTRKQRVGVKYCLPCWNLKNGLPSPKYGGERSPNPGGRCGIWELYEDKLAEEERYASTLLTTRGMTNSY